MLVKVERYLINILLKMAIHIDFATDLPTYLLTNCERKLKNQNLHN